jgi:hypothetical protein
MLGVIAVKLFQKGSRARTEEYLHDYNVRKANVDAAEKTFWDEELSLHSLDVHSAEASVYRQRLFDWTYRMDPLAYSNRALAHMLPVKVTDSYSLKAVAEGKASAAAPAKLK